MTVDRLAALIEAQHDRTWLGESFPAYLADVVRAAYAADPTILGTERAPQCIVDDIAWAARAIRGSSWPGDMAQDVENRAARLTAFAASDIYVTPRGAEGATP